MLPGKFDELPRPQVSIKEWLDLLLGPSFTKLLTAAKRVALERQRNQAAGAGVQTPNAEHIIRCEFCNSTWATEGDLKNHMHRAHGFRSLGRYYAPTNTCLNCLCVFGNRQRLVSHFLCDTGKVSLDVLRANFQPLEETTVMSLDAAALAISQSGARVRPAYRCLGPRLDPHCKASSVRSFQAMDWT